MEHVFENFLLIFEVQFLTSKCCSNKDVHNSVLTYFVKFILKESFFNYLQKKNI